MAKPKVLVLRSPGANCDDESAEAFRLAGGVPERIHINRLIEKPDLLAEHQILCVPGGFSYGDDVAAGRVLGNQVRRHLADACQRFRDDGKLALGICNGFQVLIKTGLMDVDDADGPLATLTWNDHGRYEARWVSAQATPGDCVFLQGIERVDLPIAHAEGKIAIRDESAARSLVDDGRVVLRYADPEAPGTSDEPLSFPHNPNGSAANAAGLTDSTGRVLGLMPHPERFLFATQHPRWTRKAADGTRDPRSPGDGLLVFRNAVDYFN